MQQAQNPDDLRLKSLINEGLDGEISLIGFPHDHGANREGVYTGQENAPGKLPRNRLFSFFCFFFLSAKKPKRRNIISDGLNCRNTPVSSPSLIDSNKIVIYSSKKKINNR